MKLVYLLCNFKAADRSDHSINTSMTNFSAHFCCLPFLSPTLAQKIFKKQQKWRKQNGQ
jgi:hypothetical protein